MVNMLPAEHCVNIVIVSTLALELSLAVDFSLVVMLVQLCFSIFKEQFGHENRWLAFMLTWGKTDSDVFRVLSAS